MIGIKACRIFSTLTNLNAKFSLGFYLALIKDWPLPDKVGWKIFVHARARELFFGCSAGPAGLKLGQIMSFDLLVSSMNPLYLRQSIVII